MTASKPNWIGQTLSGRYRIDALLGQGGMSAVYRAYDPNLRRTVAVKLIHSHLSSDPEFVRRFEQEAGAVAALRHPNIVQVFDFNHDGDTFYMVMEYVEGQSLQQRLRQLGQRSERLPLTETLDLLATIATAVGFAHQQGLVHRDLKPANIMLNPAGQPVLMDFGVVKIVGGQQHTATGVVVGTPMYVAPELIRGRKPDARTDLYSLGIMLYEMLAGHPPFDAGTAMALMLKHVNEPVPDIRAERPDVPPAIARVVTQALAKDPNERFQTAGEFANALRNAHLRERPARPVASTAAWAPTGVATAAPAPPAPLLPGVGQRRGPLLLACGGLLVLVLLVSAVATALAVNAALNQDRVTATATQTVTEAATPAPSHSAVPASATAAVAASATTAPTTAVAASPTGTARPTFIVPPSATQPPPTWTTAPPTATTEPPTHTPTVTNASPTLQFRARITDVSIVNDRYAVRFETIGYQAALPGQHVHFFFDTVPPELAGVPASGSNWIVHAAEPNPFTGYAVSDRPSGATAMCILVANPNHSINLDSGNCWPLP